MTEPIKGPQQLALEAEFPAAMLGKVRKGGSDLTYVPAAEVITRLNDVLGVTGWDWETTKVWRDETDADWILATGFMTATVDDIRSRKSGEGGVKLKRTTTKQEIVDLGDEFKGAASDALKKAAQKFGVALYLARKDDARKYETPAPVRDAVEDGYENDGEQRTLANRFAAAMKTDEAVAAKVREERNRLGVIWPPTRYELDILLKYVDELNPALAVIARDGPQKPGNEPKAQQGTGGPEPTPQAPSGPGGGWASEEERDAETERVIAKCEDLADDEYARLETWSKENDITLPTTKTNLLRYEAFMDAIAQPVPEAEPQETLPIA